MAVRLKPLPVEVQQQQRLPTTSPPPPPPRHTLTIIATEFASELILEISTEIVVRLLTVTVRIMATLKCPVWRRELCGVRSRAVVSQTVKQAVAVRWVQPSPAPLSLMSARIPQQPRSLKSIATRSVTGPRLDYRATAVTSPTATVRATATLRWNVTRTHSGVPHRMAA